MLSLEIQQSASAQFQPLIALFRPSPFCSLGRSDLSHPGPLPIHQQSGCMMLVWHRLSGIDFKVPAIAVDLY